MIDRRTQIKLSSKINKIMKDCETVAEGKDGSDLALFHGYTEATKNNNYTYSITKIPRYIPDLLELCRMLPKIQTKSDQTAGIISYADLVTEVTNIDAQVKGYVVADHFINLLNLSNVGFLNEMDKDGKHLVFSVLNPRYKEQLFSSKVNTEPDEK